MTFEWHPRKAAQNVRKHSVSFEEAATCFGDPLSVTIRDPSRSERETRLVLMGLSGRGRLLVVVHAERDDRIRVISARKATPQERRAYEGEPEG
ncbi:MAG: BrnT family toxin [Planctomycetota bacterium]